MTKPPAFLGKIVYFFGYPIFRILIKNTNRAYVLIRYENEILLTKNWLGFQQKWRLAGGGIHKNEDPKIAVLRELREELGISANPERLMQITPQPIRAKYNYNYYLYVLNEESRLEFKPDDKEILEAKYIDINNISRNLISEEVKKAIELTF